MHSCEPAKKKLKQGADVDNSRAEEHVETAETLVKRDLSSVSDPCQQAEFGAPAKAANRSEHFTVFVLDVNNRLFATG